MVATSQPLAALAGVTALERGGNAVDAALAAAGVLAVTEPNQCGPGGDLFAIVVRDGEEPAGLNASGRAPEEPGELLPTLHGPCSVTVPGCVAGWTELAERYARFGLAEALAPAIELARRGFELGPRAEHCWTADVGELGGEAAEVFRPTRPWSNPAIAGALEEAAEGRFYTGPVAESIASASWLTTDDLAAHTCEWVTPLRFSYRDHTLLELPPNGQGSIAGWALESLASPAPADQIEALAAAYDRGYAVIGDTAYACAVDGEGMGVSLIQSIFWGFGSRVIAPGFGFMLQNRGAGFVLEPGHPNEFRPSKRPFHTIIPAALLGPDGRWRGVFGVTGGQFQPQGHVQLIVNLLDHGMHPQQALDAPRFRLEEEGHVTLEPPLAPLADEIAERPVRVVDDETNFGNGHVILREPDGRLLGGSEPRRDGFALGL
jgi:gamma-glutamyltranspeptidase/glutathione hydrolase